MWIGYCEEVPEARTQGETREEVLQNLQDAVVLILEDLSPEELEEFRDTLAASQREFIAF
jgi:predicted RNase H-like HicB family nuclease